MKLVVAVLLAVFVAACVGPASRQADRYFLLQGVAPDSGASRVVSGVIVAPTSAPSFYDTQDIVYSRAPGTRAYYQFNHWTERPPRAIHAQLASRLEDGAAKGGRVLNTRVDEIYHDAADSPGTARITLTAELVDPATRAVLARRTFSRTAPATSYDADGAVHGFNEALGSLLDDIIIWVGVQLPATK